MNAKLAKAEEDKAAAYKRVADAKVALTQAQKALSDAKSNVQRLTDILAIDKALAVYQDTTGVVSAVTRETPSVEELPAFDLNAELNGYKVTQNEDGIGATTVDAPTVTPTELPSFDLNGELNGYKVTQNEDGIGATTVDTPTVTLTELPAFDLNAELNGYKTSPKHAGARPNDTPSQTLSTFSRKDATKQELPNTGSYSRVERQIALGGYTILGLILGFTIQRKRER